MSDSINEILTLRRQQAAIAGFGGFALRQADLQTILNEAARVCAEGLGAPFCKICRYREEHDDLLMEAGFGWNEGVVGNVVAPADESSPQGKAFASGQPSIVHNLREDNNFKLPPFYAEYGIISTVDVIIKGDGRPYGVLEIDNNQQKNYDEHDINFLTGFANIVAEAVATSVRTTILQSTIEEKERLLEQKNVLAEELQHRVRNNLQLVYGMLSKQLSNTEDAAGRRGIRSIARRVSTLAQVYDNLLGSEMSNTTDFGVYATSLCNSMAEIQENRIKLTCHCDSLVLDLNTVTALGIVITELVTNSYDHAFPRGDGTIEVLLNVPGLTDGDMATLTITDDGIGFVPEYESKRHGLGLVQRLVEQIRGTVEVKSDAGTAWTIKFPKNPTALSG